MVKYVLSSLSGFVLLTVCTVLLGIFRIEIIQSMFENDAVAKSILLPVNFMYVFSVSYGFVRLNRTEITVKRALQTGIIWAFSAVFLDFFIGYFGEKKSLFYLLEQFNILHGNTWGVVVILIALMPFSVRKYVVK